jgi:hypothetical protein
MQAREVNDDRPKVTDGPRRVTNQDPAPPNTRLIVTPPATTPGEPIPFEQTAETTGVHLKFKRCDLKFIYDVTSDDGLVRSLSHDTYLFTPISLLTDDTAGSEADDSTSNRLLLGALSIGAISPGRWQVTSKDVELFDLTVQPRPYVLEKRNDVAAIEAGTKRHAGFETTSSKHHQNDDNQIAPISHSSPKVSSQHPPQGLPPTPP